MATVTADDGASIWWEEHGRPDGPPVLLIMGLAYPAAMWFRLLPHLEDRYRLLLVDNRGAGRTGDVDGAPYSVERMAADCVAVLDAAGADRAHVIGISMGGLMAQEVALTRPDRVRSLALLATHPGFRHGVVTEEAEALLTARTAMTPEQALEASVPFNYAPTTPRSTMEEDWGVRLPLAATLKGYLAQWNGHQSWDGLDRLPGLQAPTLVVHGDGDRLVRPQCSQLLADAIPGARLHWVVGANHLLTSDQPQVVGQLLREWLDEHP